MLNKNLYLVIILLAVLSACQNMNLKENKNEKMKRNMEESLLPIKDLGRFDREIEEYIARNKFAEGASPDNPGYPGLMDEQMRRPLNAQLNLLAKTFQKIAHHHSTVEGYQDAIKQLLEIMEGVYLDSEDQDQFCISIEELMDIVGLESSGGLLNTWRYGFDPTEMERDK